MHSLSGGYLSGKLGDVKEPPSGSLTQAPHRPFGVTPELFLTEIQVSQLLRHKQQTVIKNNKTEWRWRYLFITC